MSSLPRTTTDEKSTHEHQVQAAEEETVGSSSSSGRRLNNITTTKSFPHQFSLLPNKKSKVEESDEDLFTVPDLETPTPISSAVMVNVYGNHNMKENSAEVQHQTGLSGKRRRGRNPVDKEYRRLKRLLRNRVSAQQARERKKVYVNELESRANELQDMNSTLEEKISTLVNENTMLRKVLMNTRPKNDESEQKQDRLSKS